MTTHASIGYSFENDSEVNTHRMPSGCGNSSHERNAAIVCSEMACAKRRHPSLRYDNVPDIHTVVYMGR